jgi:hypothetical protein
MDFLLKPTLLHQRIQRYGGDRGAVGKVAGAAEEPVLENLWLRCTAWGF